MTESYILTQIIQLRDDFGTMLDMVGIRGTIDEWMNQDAPKPIKANKRSLPLYNSIIRKYKQNIKDLEKVKYNG